MKRLLKIAVLSYLLITPMVYAENMPDDVLARVKESAAEDWPDEFIIQKFIIASSKSAYRFLSTYSPANVPPDVFKRIKRDAENDWPDEFGIQVLMIKGQVDAYRDLQK
jgi:hypothetical protein